MTMTDRPIDEALLVKIEKLLRQAEDPAATAPERDAFHAHAMRMMERYRIDRSMIGGRLAEDDVIGDYPFGKITGGVYSRVRVLVVDAVAKAFDCRTYWKSYGNGPKNLYVFGFRSDADLVITLARRLLLDADRQAADVPGGVYARRGFFQGYAIEVGRRLQAATAEARAEAELDGVDTTSTALVLVDRRAQIRDAYAARNIRTAAPAAWGSSAGHAQGREAGARANLATGSNQVGTGRKALGR